MPILDLRRLGSVFRRHGASWQEMWIRGYVMVLQLPVPCVPIGGSDDYDPVSSRCHAVELEQELRFQTPAGLVLSGGSLRQDAVDLVCTHESRALTGWIVNWKALDDPECCYLDT